jgi:hypothetical protein
MKLDPTRYLLCSLGEEGRLVAIDPVLESEDDTMQQNDLTINQLRMPVSS